MRLRTIAPLIAFVLAPALAFSCGGSGESDEDLLGQPGAAGASGKGGGAGASGSKAGSSGASGSGAKAGSSGSSAGGSGAAGGGSAAGGSGAAGGGTSTGGSSAAGGSAAGGTGGVGGGLIGVDGGSCGLTQCTDCIDNDGDGKIDGFDPECTGYLDNDESSFSTAIPGDNVDACKQDCFFDGNSGMGDDGCDWDLACDPLNPGGNLPKACPYDPDKQNCPGPPSETCLKNCMKNVPNGCDCFGCCAFQTPQGPKSVLLLPACTFADINDPTRCPPCTQQAGCLNPCDTCELCLGKDELPPECGAAGATGAGGSATAGAAGATAAGTGGTTSTAGAGGTTSAGGSTSTGGSGPLPVCGGGDQPCTPTVPCAAGYYCLTGCCQVIIN